MISFDHNNIFKRNDNIKQVNIDLKDYIKENNLNKSLLTESESTIILLPNNNFLKSLPEDKNYFSPVTKNIMECFKKEGLDTKTYDDGKKKTEIILKSADILIPTIFFLSGIPVGLALSVLGNWIYDKFVKNKNAVSNIIKFEYVEVMDDKKNIKITKIEGNANDVSKLLKKE